MHVYNPIYNPIYIHLSIPSIHTKSILSWSLLDPVAELTGAAYRVAGWEVSSPMILTGYGALNKLLGKYLGLDYRCPIFSESLSFFGGMELLEL